MHSTNRTHSTHTCTQVTVTIGGVGKTIEEVMKLRRQLVPLGMAVDCIIDRNVEMSEEARHFEALNSQDLERLRKEAERLSGQLAAAKLTIQQQKDQAEELTQTAAELKAELARKEQRIQMLKRL